MICENNFQCREVATGWREKRGTVLASYKVVQAPVDRAHAFQVWLTGLAGGSTVQILVDNALVMDAFALAEGQIRSYVNGSLTTGERLTIIVDGAAKYKYKYMRKTYA